jgi:hypothetical protein
LQAAIKEIEEEKLAKQLGVKDTKNIKADELKKKADELKRKADELKGKKKARFIERYAECFDWLKYCEDLKKICPKRDKAKKSLENARKEVVKAIIAKVPLKELYEKQKEYQFSSPLEKEKNKAEKELKDIEAKLKAEIENGSLQLQYAGEAYDQFAIKALKQ